MSDDNGLVANTEESFLESDIHPIPAAQETMEPSEELEPGMVAVTEAINQPPAMLPLAAVKRLVKAKEARLVRRVELSRPVYEIWGQWYEEVGLIRNGWVFYQRCSDERKAEIEAGYPVKIHK
jgi:hypothetical protein